MPTNPPPSKSDIIKAYVDPLGKGTTQPLTGYDSSSDTQGGAASGPTAPIGSSTNLPFDDRHRQPNPFSGYIFRGNLQRRDNPNYKLFFFYNPNSIQMQYTLREDIFNSNAIDQAAAKNLLTATFVSWSIDLRFDRHYEVTYHNDHEGVNRDLVAFERLVGFKPEQFGPHMGTIDPTAYDWFLGNYLQLYGRIMGCSIEFTQFSNYMVPMVMDMKLSGAGVFGDNPKGQSWEQPAGTKVGSSPGAPAGSASVSRNGTRYDDGKTRYGTYT